MKACHRLYPRHFFWRRYIMSRPQSKIQSSFIRTCLGLALVPMLPTFALWIHMLDTLPKFCSATTAIFVELAITTEHLYYYWVNYNSFSRKERIIWGFQAMLLVTGLVYTCANIAIYITRGLRQAYKFEALLVLSTYITMALFVYRLTKQPSFTWGSCALLLLHYFGCTRNILMGTLL